MSAVHLGRCGWFWAWAAVGFGLALSFLAVFSIGPFLVPFVTLGLGMCAARRGSWPVAGVGALLAVLGAAAGFAAQDAFLVTPLVTLAVGLSPAVPRTAAGVGRVAVCALLACASAAAVVAMQPGDAAVLVVLPIALVAFAVAAVGELRPEMSGLVAGAGLLGLAVRPAAGARPGGRRGGGVSAVCRSALAPAGA